MVYRDMTSPFDHDMERLVRNYVPLAQAHNAIRGIDGANDGELLETARTLAQKDLLACVGVDVEEFRELQRDIREGYGD